MDLTGYTEWCYDVLIWLSMSVQFITLWQTYKRKEKCNQIVLTLFYLTINTYILNTQGLMNPFPADG